MATTTLNILSPNDSLMGLNGDVKQQKQQLLMSFGIKIQDEVDMSQKQCDEMVGLFFNIWPFATMKISPIMSQICQSRLTILPNKNKLSKICQSGEISSNLATLGPEIVLHLGKWLSYAKRAPPCRSFHLKSY